MFVFFRGYASTDAPAFPVHSNIIMPYFSKYGSEEQKQKYIPDMTAGKKISAIAMTEPDAGRYKDIFFLFH
jgi:long-chain-acyl-CoA dehydrogenase